ncbi:MAG TPA: sulfurtransferase [Chitinophagales bacterium]|nr:sulfurtransferase [Chitinophagales bacterium]
METSIKKMLPLISATELSQQMSSSSIVIIDARSGKDAFEQFANNHILGALHVDLDKDLSQKPTDAANGGRHPLPDIRNFGSLLGELGIHPDSQVVVYDDKSGANAAARFWWMLKATGHQKVQVLDGGLKAASAAGLPFTSEITVPNKLADYPVDTWKLPTISLKEVEKATMDPNSLIIDVREAYRYLGESEPIDLVAGHIPNAVNIPYLRNLTSDGVYLPVGELVSLYKTALGERNPDQVIVHCGSGVTACHTLLALEQAGISGANLYVGSWSEWSRNNLPVATGN